MSEETMIIEQAVPETSDIIRVRIEKDTLKKVVERKITVTENTWYENRGMIIDTYC